MKKQTFKEFFPVKINLWTKIRMLFTKTYMSYDIGAIDYSSTIYFKKVGDKIIIIDNIIS